jgi:RND family efflux transporter MFP subunit
MPLLVAVTLPAGAAAIPDQDCVIEPHTVVDLASAVEGIVESVEVARGDLVERDQVLVRLDAGVERAAVDYARARAAASAQVRAGEANASFAQRRAGRVGVLYEQKVVSSDQMDEAATQTRLTRAQAEQAGENQRLAQLELRQAQENLARHIIRSPIRGVVVQDYLSPGESVKDKPILRLAEIDPLRVEVIVPVAYFGAIVPGQSATVRPEAPREGNFQAKVSIVDRVADAASGTFRVRLSLPNADYSLPSGLKCRVEFGPAPPAPAVKAAAPALKRDATTVTPNVTPTPSAAPEPQPPAALPGDTIAGERPASSYPRSRRLAKTISRPAPLLAAQPAAAPRRVAASGPALAIRSDIAAAPSCRTLGPIDSADRADQIKALLAGKVGRLEIRAAGNDAAPGYVILTPPQPTAEEARLLAAKMRAAGIKDLHVYGSGPKRNRIALGMYASLKPAQTRRDALATLGFAASVLPGTQPDKSLWLDMQVGNTPAALEALNRTVAAVAPGLRLAAVPCNELVAARR